MTDRTINRVLIACLIALGVCLITLVVMATAYADPCPYCGEEVVLTKAASADIKAQVRAFEATMSEEER